MEFVECLVKGTLRCNLYIKLPFCALGIEIVACNCGIKYTCTGVDI